MIKADPIMDENKYLFLKNLSVGLDHIEQSTGCIDRVQRHTRPTCVYWGQIFCWKHHYSFFCQLAISSVLGKWIDHCRSFLFSNIKRWSVNFMDIFCVFQTPFHPNLNFLLPFLGAMRPFESSKWPITSSLRQWLRGRVMVTWLLRHKIIK